MSYRFQAPLWLYEGEAPWVFVTIPVDLGEELKEEFGGGASAFGSIRVEARIGEAVWTTSIFPDRASQTYQLPIRAGVRRATGLGPGDMAEVELEVLPG